MRSDSALLRPMSLMPAASTASETAGVRYVTVTSEPHYLPVTITTGKLAIRGCLTDKKGTFILQIFF